MDDKKQSIDQEASASSGTAIPIKCPMRDDLETALVPFRVPRTLNPSGIRFVSGESSVEELEGYRCFYSDEPSCRSCILQEKYNEPKKK